MMNAGMYWKNDYRLTRIFRFYFDKQYNKKHACQD
jgi:hypothetical protein